MQKRIQNNIFEGLFNYSIQDPYKSTTTDDGIIFEGLLNSQTLFILFSFFIYYFIEVTNINIIFMM